MIRPSLQRQMLFSYYDTDFFLPLFRMQQKMDEFLTCGNCGIRSQRVMINPQNIKCM
ncbi:unnamed protein product [Larinioides sclopetarius]|uniref:Uncharacterized protein n=1 Tax=Larinioides sclopetarius TaxID=280406 RepID=A0AAV1YV20_9ARAC